jgi:tRNA splicing endonuclease
MGVSLEIVKDDLLVKDLISVQALDKGFFGREHAGKKTELLLTPEEALYWIDVRNASCEKSGKKLSFNQVAEKFESGKKFLARYFCYRDWRDRGLIPRPISEARENYGRSPVVKYPHKEFSAPRVSAKALFFFDDLMSVIDDEKEGQELYEKHWFGQYGTYKAKKHGRFLKLDAYETLFLMKHGGMQCNVKDKRLEKEELKRRHDF